MSKSKYTSGFVAAMVVPINKTLTILCKRKNSN